LASGNIVYSHPKFSSDDKSIFVVARKMNGEMSILSIALDEHPYPKKIVAYSNRIIGFLQVQHDTLVFTTTYNGRDEIWCHANGTIYRLATYNTGLYKASFQNDGSLVASAFTADGYRLAKLKPTWQQMEVNDVLTDLYVDSAFNKNDHQLLNNMSINQRSFAVKFNFHSWRPYYDAPEFSFTVYGQNILNTYQSEAAYTYNYNEGSNKVGYTGIYGGSYIESFFSVSQTWGRTIKYSRDTSFHWNELNANVGLQLPLNLSGGKQYRHLTLSSSFNVQNVDWTGLAKNLLLTEHFNYLQTSIRYTGQIQQSQKQIYPHWGQTLLIQYRNILNKYTAQQFLVSGSLYLLGIAATHSLVVSAAYQARDTSNQYYFNNDFPFSRGYNVVDFPRMMKVAANYHFPLLYPDKGFGNLVYFLRIRGDVFYDHTQAKSLRTGNMYQFNTVGAEVYFDTKWWNQQAVSFGIRYSHLLDNEYFGVTQPNVWEIILPVNLF
jgi:hypothetical protein